MADPSHEAAELAPCRLNFEPTEPHWRRAVETKTRRHWAGRPPGEGSLRYERRSTIRARQRFLSNSLTSSDDACRSVRGAAPFTRVTAFNCPRLATVSAGPSVICPGFGPGAGSVRAPWAIVFSDQPSTRPIRPRVDPSRLTKLHSSVKRLRARSRDSSRTRVWPTWVLPVLTSVPEASQEPLTQRVASGFLRTSRTEMVQHDRTRWLLVACRRECTLAFGTNTRCRSHQCRATAKMPSLKAPGHRRHITRAAFDAARQSR
jgi:hypothetical protein